MCNPPFFSSLDETRQNPHRHTKATHSELICPGGELAFLTQLITESVLYRKQIVWFSTMLGKKETLKALRRLFQSMPIQQRPVQIRTRTFIQGRQTRWGLAWTHDETVPLPTLPPVAVVDVVHP